MGLEFDSESDVNTTDVRQYRALSIAAVITLVTSMISLAALLTPWLIVIPLAGILLGLVTTLRIKARPDELTGGPMAVAGSAACALIFVLAISWHTFIYVTEVPDNYERISFYNLQAEDDYSELPIPPSALDLDGKRIFIKGYLYPDGQRHAIKKFVLVRDLGTCCFGGQPELTHMIEVTLREPLQVDFNFRVHKLGGIFTVDTQLKPVSGVNGVYYQLEADLLDGKTAHEVAPSAGNDASLVQNP